MFANIALLGAIGIGLMYLSVRGRTHLLRPNEKRTYLFEEDGERTNPFSSDEEEELNDTEWRYDP